MTNRYAFEGLRAAVLGMGVSGLSAATVLRRIGAVPTVFDQKPSDNLDVVHVTDQLQRDDIEAVSGWHGHLDPADFDLMVVSPGFRRDHPAVRDLAGKPVMSEVELAYRIAVAPIIAVTGTNGKSTTTVLTWKLLEAMGRHAVLCGNISGSGFAEQPLTAAAYSAVEGDYLVAEVSSYQLEFVQLFRPQASTILNVSPDHMDRHPSFDDYFATKLKVLDRVGDGDTIVVNSDEPSLSALRFRPALVRGAKMVSFSPSGEGVTQNEHSRRTGAWLHLGEESVDIDDLGLVGEHNVSNLMAAWELACTVDIPGPRAVAEISRFKGLDHRLQTIGTKRGVRIVNNSMCTNPAAVVASSQAVSARQHLIMGGNTKRLDFGTVGVYLASRDHVAYLFGSEQNRLNKMLGGGWPEYNSLEEAFRAATMAAAPGEVVMLSPGCASSEPYANFRERGMAFRELAMEWIKDDRKQV